MRIVVTGGCGFIGHNVVSKLEQLGHAVLIIDTMTDYGIISKDELEYLLHERKNKFKSKIIPVCISSARSQQVIADFSPELIIHLASLPRQRVVNSNPQAGSRVMCEGLLNLLEASIKSNVRKFVYISSSMVYGDFQANVTEDHICTPQGQYGIMKYMGELLIKDYARKNDLEYTIIRPSAVYGELDVEDRVLSKFMLSAIRDKTLNVNGPDEVLDFTYIDDVVTGIVSASLSNKTCNKTYNITRGQGISLLDAAKLTIDIVGRGTIEIKDRDSDFPSRNTLSIAAAKHDFDYCPRIDVREGFTRYYNWLMSSNFWQDKFAK